MTAHRRPEKKELRLVETGETTPVAEPLTPTEEGKSRAEAPVKQKKGKADAPVVESGGTIGFGFDPAETEHHFIVAIPLSGREPVYINEQFVWHALEERRHLSLALGNAESKMRVVLPLEKWHAIADEVAAEFNARLKKQGKRPGSWKGGYTEVARLFGKELVLLAWAIEDADPALVGTAIRNWKGLTPEERWWLFTMTNAATGHAVTGRNIGWRKAVRFALTESPVPEGGNSLAPTPFRLEAPAKPPTAAPSKPTASRSPKPRRK